jgi:hypothetical protein
METLYKYELFCATENSNVTCWRYNTPHVCPVNAQHEIVANSIHIVDQENVTDYTSVKPVYIQAKSWYDTKGYYQCKGYEVALLAGQSQLSIPFTIENKNCFYGMRVNVCDHNVGDEFSASINKNTIVGILVADLTIGDAVLMVSDTVSDNLIPGFYVQLGAEERLVVGVDKLAHTITVITPFENTYPSYELVLLNVYIVKNYKLECTGIQKVGYGTSSGKVFPQGTVFSIDYKNNNSTTNKKFTFNAEITY